MEEKIYSEDSIASLGKLFEELLKKIETDKPKLITELETFIAAVRKEKEAEIQIIKKELQDVQWYFGEERARSEGLELQLKEKNEYLRKMEEYSQRLKQQFDESQWFLGEEKYRREQLENTAKNAQDRCTYLERELNDLKQKLALLQKELQDAQWYLGEEKARRKELEEKLKGLEK